MALTTASGSLGLSAEFFGASEHWCSFAAAWQPLPTDHLTRLARCGMRCTTTLTLSEMQWLTIIKNGHRRRRSTTHCLPLPRQPGPPTRSCTAYADPGARWLRVALEACLLPHLADGRREATALGRVPGQDGGGAVVHRTGGRQRVRRRRA